MAFCKNCGNNNAEGVTYCAYCGATMDNGYQQPQYQQPQYQQPQYQQPQYQQPQYQQPQYQQPQYQQGYAQPAAPVPGKGLGIGSMVVGIISLVLFCWWYIAIPCGIVGIVLGVIGNSKAKAAGRKNGMATAGVVCSCISIGLTVLVLVLAIAGVAAVGSYY